ncbi:MAG: glycerol-3-phosphate acyltransferase [Anaerolineae bacterium]|nr:glycerol-3-phosphate acyltransferase [Anaerolineae bacterium]
MDQFVQIIGVIIISYLLGSIPTAYLIAKSKGIDIFSVGSGNMGATNVGRSLGFWWGIVVWACDSGKGILAILIATAILPENRAAATAISATAAVVGHNWSLFATLVTGTLRGGKGAAIWFGTMFMIAPLQVLVGMSVLGVAVIALTRYVSLAVLGMCALATIWIAVLIQQQVVPIEYIFYMLVVGLLIVFRFRENIQRLLTGTERRLGDPA